MIQEIYIKSIYKIEKEQNEPGEEFDGLAVLVHLDALAIELVFDDKGPALHELHHALRRLSCGQHWLDRLKEAGTLRHAPAHTHTRPKGSLTRVGRRVASDGVTLALKVVVGSLSS